MQKNNNGNTPLHFSDGDYKTEYLINAGANVNATNNLGNQTPLHTTQNSEVAKLLIKHGANINALDDSNMTPLMVHLSQRFGESEIISVLATQNYSQLKKNHPEVYAKQTQTLQKWVAEKPQERHSVLDAYNQAQQTEDSMLRTLGKISHNVTIDVSQPVPTITHTEQNR